MFKRPVKGILGQLKNRRLQISFSLLVYWIAVAHANFSDEWPLLMRRLTSRVSRLFQVTEGGQKECRERGIILSLIGVAFNAPDSDLLFNHGSTPCNKSRSCSITSACGFTTLGGPCLSLCRGTRAKQPVRKEDTCRLANVASTFALRLSGRRERKIS